MKTTAKPTPGEWRTLKKNPRRVVSATTPHVVIAGFYHNASKGPGIRTENSGFLPSTEEAESNASLAMEAGTVYHETGLSPREILAQRDEAIAELTNRKRAYDSAAICADTELDRHWTGGIAEGIRMALELLDASKGGEKG